MRRLSGKASGDTVTHPQGCARSVESKEYVRVGTAAVGAASPDKQELVRSF